jgi:hypothetical protein
MAVLLVLFLLTLVSAARAAPFLRVPASSTSRASARFC